MQHYIGSRARIHINREGKHLFYTAKVIDVNDSLISFVDKFNNNYSFKISDIEEIKGEPDDQIYGTE
jgi:hypothetical protein